MNLLFPDGIKCIACDEELWEAAEDGLCRKCSLQRNTSFCLRCGRASEVNGRYCLACQKHEPPITAARAPFVHEGRARSLVHGLKYGNRRYLAAYMARFMTDYFLGCFGTEVGFDAGNLGVNDKSRLPDTVAARGNFYDSNRIDGGNSVAAAGVGECNSISKTSVSGENFLGSNLINCDYSSGSNSTDGGASSVFVGATNALGIDFVTFAPMFLGKQKQRGYNQAELLAKEVARLLGLTCVGILDKLKDTKSTARLRGYQRREMLDGAIGVIPGVSFAGKTVLLVDDVFTTGATSFECARQLLGSGVNRVFVLTFATSKVKKK